MENKGKDKQVVFTNRARCRDCYRCIRVCPVDAIGIRQDQAYVDQQKCISCGTCIRECPQKAKNYSKSLEDVMELVKSPRKTAVSLAPSFASLYEKWQIARFPSVLRKLGFDYIAETSVAAYCVAMESLKAAKDSDKNVSIMTSCPAVVSYVEHYKPQLIDNLLPVSSPMIVHSAMLKQQFGNDVEVVFIGPCIAKKAEAIESPQSRVDHVITFEELDQWLEKEGVDFAQFEESDFDQQPQGWARKFPLAGGCLQTSGLSTDMLSGEIISVCGHQQLDDVLESINDKEEIIIEPLFCEGGCINGPAMQRNKTLYQRRKNILNFCDKPLTEKDYKTTEGLKTQFVSKAVTQAQISEDKIRKVFLETGKEAPEDQLNCGACGYNTCREQAIAVLREMAEPDMCIPFIRKLAQQRTDKIIETSPNGIVILDENLSILHMNDSFRKMFMCTNSNLGKNISFLMEPEIFEEASYKPSEVTEMIADHSKYNLVCNQIIYCLKEERQIVGIFVNLTSNLKNKQQLNALRQQTLDQARNLLDHQLDLAGQLAMFVGESTAKSEKLLDNLMKMAAQDSTVIDDIDKEDKRKWLKNIYTQK